jgi:pilus assembly protein CpaE
MGRQEHNIDITKDSFLPLPSSLTIVATESQLENLRSFEDGAWITGASLVPMPLDAELNEEALKGTQILVLQVDPNVPASMRRIQWLRERRPDISQIVALDSTDIKLVRTLVRQGVSDVVALPLDPEELLQAAVAILEVQARSSGSTQLAPMIATARALGASGSTTMVTHLARQLALEPECTRGVCIIDLDIQFGAVSEMLGMAPRRTLSDLLEAEERLDGSFLRTAAGQHETGIWVIAAPLEIVPLEAIDTTKLQSILALARQEFDYVLLDMPSDWSSWSLSIMLDADSILMVAEQSLSSLRQARRRLDLFKSVGVDPRIVSIVVNRVEKRLFGTISLSDVADTLNHEVLIGLRHEGQAIPDAQAQGVLLDQIKPKANYVADIKRLTELLHSRLAAGARA